MRTAVNQSILIERFTKYIDIAVMNGKQDRNTLMQKLSIEKGLCNGFAIVHSYMNAVDKLPWWKELLEKISRWEGKTLESLHHHFPTPKDISEFERALDYVLFHQALESQTGIIGLSQENLFDQWFSEKIHFKKVFPSQKHTVESLEMILNPSVFSKKETLFLLGIERKTLTSLGNTRHLCSLRFDTKTQHWFFYDANNAPGEIAFADIATLYYTLSTQYKTNRFNVAILSFNPNLIEFPTPAIPSYTEQLQSAQRQLLCLERHYHCKVTQGDNNGFQNGIFGRCFSAKTKLNTTRNMLKIVNAALESNKPINLDLLENAAKNGKLSAIFNRLETLASTKTTPANGLT